MNSLKNINVCLCILVIMLCVTNLFSCIQKSISAWVVEYNNGEILKFSSNQYDCFQTFSKIHSTFNCYSRYSSEATTIPITNIKRISRE